MKREKEEEKGREGEKVGRGKRREKRRIKNNNLFHFKINKKKEKEEMKEKHVVVKSDENNVNNKKEDEEDDDEKRGNDIGWGGALKGTVAKLIEWSAGPISFIPCQKRCKKCPFLLNAIPKLFISHGDPSFRPFGIIHRMLRKGEGAKPSGITDHC